LAAWDRLSSLSSLPLQQRLFKPKTSIDQDESSSARGGAGWDGLRLELNFLFIEAKLRHREN
jgi:hypothetical protein